MPNTEYSATIRQSVIVVGSCAYWVYKQCIFIYDNYKDCDKDPVYILYCFFNGNGLRHVSCIKYNLWIIKKETKNTIMSIIGRASIRNKLVFRLEMQRIVLLPNRQIPNIRWIQRAEYRIFGNYSAKRHSGGVLRLLGL